MSSERLFTAIKDGEWHKLNELASQIEFPLAKLEECARDLGEKGIVEYREATQEIRMEPEWKILLPNENLLATTQPRPGKSPED